MSEEMLIKGPMPMTRENRLKARSEVKTQTRRVIKNMPEKWHRGYRGLGNDPNGNEEFIIYGDCGTKTMYAPYSVGDIVYVPEPYEVVSSIATDLYIEGIYLDDRVKGYFDVNLTEREWKLWVNRKKPYAPTQARFMYKSLARDFYEILRVWVERTQDISIEDIKKEGLRFDLPYTKKKDLGWYYFRPWKELWDSINKKRGYGWDKNPWVFCYEFKKVEVDK